MRDWSIGAEERVVAFAIRGLDDANELREPRGMTGFLTDFAARYAALKNKLAVLTGAQEDLLHVHAGLLIFVVAALILRRKMRSPAPLIVVVAFAAVNELLDQFGGEPASAIEPYVDFANTVFWPAILFVIARRWR